jgi:hypothetical protein
MLPRKGHRLGFLFALLVAAAGGCGGKNKPVRVEGIVTLDGNPLAGATITFVPEQEGRRPASGVTDDDGSFELTTFQAGDGALAGDYKVTVSKGVDQPIPEGDPEKGLAGKKIYHSDAKSPKNKKTIAARAASSPVPAVYRDSSRTPLKQSVPPEGTVRVELRSSLH